MGKATTTRHTTLTMNAIYERLVSKKAGSILSVRWILVAIVMKRSTVLKLTAYPKSQVTTGLPSKKVSLTFCWRQSSIVESQDVGSQSATNGVLDSSSRRLTSRSSKDKDNNKISRGARLLSPDKIAFAAAVLRKMASSNAVTNGTAERFVVDDTT